MTRPPGIGNVEVMEVARASHGASAGQGKERARDMVSKRHRMFALRLGITATGHLQLPQPFKGLRPVAWR